MKPVALKQARVSVHIYSVPVGKRKRWEVRWRFGGKQHRRKCSTKKAAVFLADEKAVQIANGHSAKGRISEAMAYEAERATQLLAPLGVSILQVTFDYLERHKAAARQESSTTVAQLVERFIAAKTAQDLSAYHLRDLEIRLGKFAQDFRVPVSRVTADLVARWLDGLKLKSARTWNNYRASVAALFAWAAAQGEAKEGLLGQLLPRKLKKSRPEVFTPAELRLLLEGAADSMVPPLALGAFAGLRSEEIARLQWSDFKWEAGYILLREHVTKTARARQVPILPNLKAWLAPWHAAAGPVCRHKDSKSLSSCKRALATRVGFAWKGNALRKSFISYRVAETGNVPATALEVGNSAGMIHAHYLDLVTPKTAAEWFSIRPQNVSTGLLRLEFR